MDSFYIRSARKDDLEALYDICLKTGDCGADATKLYKDPKLLGHIYVGPYLSLDGTICLVAEDESGIAGYVIGALDTRAFEQRLEEEWWPDLRRSFAEPSGDRTQWTADERCCYLIHNPEPVPEDVIRGYPAHIHMNILPRAQRQGLGKRLGIAWRNQARRAGAPGLHGSVASSNASILAFGAARGVPVLRSDRAWDGTKRIWFGRRF